MFIFGSKAQFQQMKGVKEREIFFHYFHFQFNNLIYGFIDPK